MKSIQTERLILRPFEQSDYKVFYDLHKDDQVMKYIPIGEITDKLIVDRWQVMLKHWKQFNFGMFAVIRKSDDKMIGYCGLRHFEDPSEIEIGYIFAKEYWGKGYAKEAAQASFKYAFETLKIKRLVACVAYENIKSVKILTGLGMKFEKEYEYKGTITQYYSYTLKY